MQIKRFIRTDVGLAKFDGRRYRLKNHTYLHRRVYEKTYGKIPHGFEVHHKDGNKFNNHADNLQAMRPNEHKKIHRKMKDKKYCIEIIENTIGEAMKEAPMILTYGDNLPDLCELEEVAYNIIGYF